MSYTLSYFSSLHNFGMFYKDIILQMGSTTFNWLKIKAVWLIFLLSRPPKVEARPRDPNVVRPSSVTNVKAEKHLTSQPLILL